MAAASSSSVAKRPITTLPWTAAGLRLQRRHLDGPGGVPGAGGSGMGGCLAERRRK